MKKNILLFTALLLANYCFSQMPVKKQTVLQPLQTEKKAGTTIVPGPKYTKVPVPDYAKATLVDAYIYVTTNGEVDIYGNDNKDPDTHWSCGTFDQVGNPITSFHDDSDHDEYSPGSTKILQMHVDKVAALGDFQNLGRLHINIAPNGNDKWRISNFTLVMDFDNPKSQQKLVWNKPFALSQDHADIDLYFHFDGTNLVARQN